MSALISFLYVGLGGMAGAMTRYGLSLATQRWSVVLPWGTLLSNILGCFVIGIIVHLALRSDAVTPEMRLLGAVGFCGGFTTMSSFIYEAMEMVRDDAWLQASVYATGTLLGSTLAFFLGVALVGLVTRA
jgi:CrcB protein